MGGQTEFSSFSPSSLPARGVDDFACVTFEINLPEVINLIKGIPGNIFRRQYTPLEIPVEH
jgi:hypothetical protein